MDGSEFDRLTQRLASGVSRRNALRAAQAGLMTLLGGIVPRDASAKRKRGNLSRNQSRQRDRHEKDKNKKKSHSKPKHAANASEELKVPPRGHADWTIDDNKREKRKSAQRNHKPNRSGAPTARLDGFTTQVSSSTTSPAAGSYYTVTATANQDVGPTIYYIRIYRDNTRVASCGYGTRCTFSTSHSSGTYNYQSRIEDWNGTIVAASSGVVTVRVSGSTAFFNASISTSTTSPQVNKTFSVTATTTRDVGPTPYYIRIYRNNVSVVTCGSGTRCSYSETPRANANYTFQARVESSSGSEVVSRSNTLTLYVRGGNITVTGYALCGLSRTSCSQLTLSGRTASTYGILGNFVFRNVPGNLWYTLRLRFFSSVPGSIGYYCKDYRVWVGVPSTGLTYDIGTQSATLSNSFRC